MIGQYVGLKKFTGSSCIRNFDPLGGEGMAKKKSDFDLLTGFWQRRGANGQYLYGKPKISEPITIYPGDELLVFDSAAANVKPGDPCKFLKIKRAKAQSDESKEDI